MIPDPSECAVVWPTGVFTQGLQNSTCTYQGNGCFRLKQRSYITRGEWFGLLFVHDFWSELGQCWASKWA